MVKNLNIFFLFGLVSFAGYNGASQPLTWTNLTSHQPSSKIIYTTIENKLLLSTANHAAVTQCIRCNAQFRGDTLVIEPTETGSVTISITTNGSTQDILLTARPVPTLQLTLDGHPQGRIRIAKFNASQKFILSWDPSSDDYWQGFQVDNFYATAGIAGVMNAGANPSRELVEMVKRSPKGTPLTISMLNLANPVNGRKEHLKTSYKFVIN